MALPNKFVAKTLFGNFQIKISNKSFITIGSKNDCVQISIKPNKQATLEWLGTDKGGCEESGKTIHGKDTIAMVDLGFTIMKQLVPDTNPFVHLRDSSKFDCTLQNGRKTSISNMIYNLLIKGETYYQDKFNASLLYTESQDALTKYVTSWSDSIDKDFDFENDELNMELKPLLNESNSWKEFMEKVYKTYGQKTCLVIHSWYLRLYGMLAKIPIHSDWKIDISKRDPIEYEISEVRNARSNTRKVFEYNPFTFEGGGHIPSLLSYKNIALRHVNCKTRKIRKFGTN